MSARQRLVVVGNGMAGARLVEEVLARDSTDSFEIIVFDEEAHGNYNRILLSSVLAREYDIADTFMNSPSWYAEKGVRLYAGVRVGWIDRLSKIVHAPGGIAEPYDRLVLATGSLPIIPLMEATVPETGELKSGVFVFRTLDDCEAIAEYASRAGKAAIIGGGLLGLEAARGLMNRGLEVDVIHLMPFLMEQQLDSVAGATLKQSIEGLGIRVHLEKTTAAVLGTDTVTGLTFKDGSTLGCDMLVICAGVRPNVELARQAGLSVQRGVLVNDDLSCRNDSDVYAIGECAQHQGQVYGLVAPVWEQARVLAERLTGANPDAVYKGSRVATKLKVAGIELTVMGEKQPHADDEVVTYLEPSRGVYKKLLVREGRIVGAILLGDGLNVPRTLQAFDRGEVIARNRSELLFAASSETVTPDVAQMPEGSLVCYCNSVSKGKIVASVQAGNRTLAAVRAATRAGTGCGACSIQIEAVIEFAERTIASPAAGQSPGL